MSQPKSQEQTERKERSTSLLPANSSLIQAGENRKEESKEDALQIIQKSLPSFEKKGSGSIVSTVQVEKVGLKKEKGQINPERFFGAEKPKTANEAFGSIGDFLLFFENRNLEIKAFANTFHEMEKTQDSSLLNKEIRPLLYQSLLNISTNFKDKEPQKELSKEIKEDPAKKKLTQMLAKIIKKKAQSQQQGQQNVYAKLFAQDFRDLQEFYKQILHAYTLPGFLYKRMNEFLRNEDWTKLDDLLLYAYCLFKAFLWGPAGLNTADRFEYLKGECKGGKLTLYRRADFDQEFLEFYDPNRVKNFSWNAVTSTSLDESITRKFWNRSVSKVPVLMVIEVDFRDLKAEDFNALSLEEFSKVPEEKEVALAPGSIFEIIQVNREKDEVELRLKLVRDAKSLAHQGQFMHGMLQAVMKKNNELRIVCLREKELSNAIRHCTGNQLIEELEFYICEFNKRSGEILLKVLPTLKNLTSLTFCSVQFEADDDIEGILELIGKLKVKKLKILSSFSKNQRLRIVKRRLDCLAGLEQFKLSFVDGHEITEDFTKEFIAKVINSLSPECTFDLSLGNDLNLLIKGVRGGKEKEKLDTQLDRIFKNTQRDTLRSFYKNITEVRNKKGWNQETLLAGLKTRPKEELIDDGFQVPEEEEREVIGKCLPAYAFADNDSRFREGNLNDLLESRYHPKINLERLEINFGKCVTLTNRHLCLKGIEDFSSLTALHLHLSNCKNITNIGLRYLSIYGLQKLSSLTRLEINIEGCFNVTDEGLMFLFFEGIRYLEKLASLSLGFEYALGGGISDESLNVLAGTLNKNSLRDLQLTFKKCYDLTEFGLEALFCKGIQHLELLESLNLGFPDFRYSTDKSLQDLSQALRNLQWLTSFSLDFSRHYETSNITSKGLASLSEAIGHLQRLESLKLDFDEVWGITSKGLYALSTGALSKLASLKTLNLGFSWTKMAADAITILSYEGLQKLYALTSLELRFNQCQKIGNKSLMALSQYGLRYLTNLVSLRLSFNNCPLIKSGGLRCLAAEGLLHLESLEALDLSFDQCNELTDEGLEILGMEGIQQLLTLKSLRLSFNSCSKITSNGFKHLTQEGISKLLFLEILSLSFDQTEMASEGLKAFFDEEIQGLQCLTSLSLSLNNCQRLTDLNKLRMERLAGLENLRSVNLDFANCEQVTQDMLEELTKKIPKLSMPSAEKRLVRSSKDTLAVENMNVAKVVLRDQFGFYSKESPEVTSFSLTNIAKTRGKINKLKLDFENLFVCEKLIREIFSEDTREIVKGLRSFEINFKCNNFIRNPILSCLGKEGLQYMSLLETLSINLDQHSKIKDLGVINLCGKGIQHLKKLNSLELSFVNCIRITDRGLKGIMSEGVQHLHSLKKLSLNFNLCSRISDKGLRFLAKQGLQKLESLCVLDLNFGQGSSLKKELFEFNSHFGNSFLMSMNMPLPSDRVVRAGRQMTASQCGFLHSTKITDKGLRNLYDEGIRNLKGLKALRLNFEGREQITNDGLKSLSFEGPKNLSQLDLNFDWCKKITDEGLKILGSNGIKSLENLTSLYLSFDGFLNISDEGLSRLYSEGILKLKKLEDLNMSFDGCLNVKASFIQNKDSFNLLGSTFLDPKLNKFQNFIDDGFKDYFEKSPIEKFVVILNERFSNNLKRFTLKRLVSNQALNDFKEKNDLLEQRVIMEPLPNFWCQGDRRIREIGLLELLETIETPPTSLNLFLRSGQNLTDERLQNLCSRDFQAFLPLTCLWLKFAESSRITDRGIKSLSMNVLKYLQRLVELNLTFDEETQIGSEGLISICQDGIQYLQNLKRLTLCLEGCQGITDEGIESLCHESFLQDKPLKSLALNLSGCVKITENGFKILFEKGIQNYKGLTSLDLRFNGCRQMKDIQLFQGLKHLVFLKTLVLSFDGCPQITDKELGALLLNGMRGLTRLDLSFNGCPRITDEGIKNLCEFGISALGNKLTHLRLLFDNCLKITDKGINNLSSQGIKNLQSLGSLILSFNNCYQTTDEGLKWLAVEGIQQINLLKVLSLSLQNCVYITSEGLKSLSAQGIQHLKFLEELEFDFDETKGITDEGLESLCSEGLQYLTETLRTVKLRFFRAAFTEKGVENILYYGTGKLGLLKRFQFQGGLELKDFWKYGIDRLEHLEVLDLAFTTFDLRDLGNLLGGPIMSLKSLVELSLEFLFCEQHSQENLRQTPVLFNYVQLPRLCKPFKVDGQRVSNTVAVQKKRITESKNKVFIAYTNEPSFYLSEKPDQIMTSLEEVIINPCKLDSLNIELKNGSLLGHNALELFTISDDSLDLKHLTSLSLKFDGYSEMTEKGLAMFIYREIKQLQSLTALDFSFIGCTNLTNSCFKVLCDEGIRHLKRLTSLNLNFGQCFEITDAGLECLFSEGVLNFETLKIWGLGFAGCRKITDRGLISLCNNGLRQAKSLTVLHLNFDQCQGISDEGLKVLVTKGIQARSSLSELSFSFVDCHRISYDTSFALLKILNYFGFEKEME